MLISPKLDQYAHTHVEFARPKLRLCATLFSIFQDPFLAMLRLSATHVAIWRDSSTLRSMDFWPQKVQFGDPDLLHVLSISIVISC